MQKKHPYIMQGTVRDYECDAQGIVNNAVYLQYLEHARNTIIYYTNTLGTLSDLHKKGEDPVVARVEIDYKQPLRGQDSFEIHTTFQKKGTMRIVFLQHVYRVIDVDHHSNIDVDHHTSTNNMANSSILIASAQTYIAVVHQGKPVPINSSRFRILFDISE